MSRSITPTDLHRAIEEKEGEREELQEALTKAQQVLAFATLNNEPTEDAAEQVELCASVLATWEEGEGESLKEHKAVLDEIGEESAIHADDWVEYVQELVEDIGDLPRKFPSYIVIDWDATADNVKQDYSSVTFEGTEYYYRNC